MHYQNLSFLQDAFLHTQNIHTWCLTSDMQLVFSNCTEEKLFMDLFFLSSCRNAIEIHFSQSTIPLLATDSTGIVWISICQYTEKNKASFIYLLGPTFISEITTKYLRQHCQKMGLTASAIGQLLQATKKIPVITSGMAASHANMLHYCLNNEATSLADIQVWNEPTKNPDDPDWGDSRWHGSWITEQRIFKSIMEGRVAHTDFNIGSIGNIGGGDPLRQAKNEMIVFTTLCCRASILGGVSSEGAYNLSDSFIQLIENTNTISGVHNIGAEMQTAYVQRVRKAKATCNHTPLVRACIEYVDTHIREKIALRDLAQEIGYNEYYISRTFKNETAESLTEYINRQKILLAQAILKDSQLSIAEISDMLSFSSSSYFITVFKKQVGVSPAEYRRAHKKSNDTDAK